MSHPLSDLRKAYIDTETKVLALTRSGQAIKDEAREVSRSLQAAATTNQVIVTRELMDDLDAIETNYKRVAGELESAKSALKDLSARISQYYNDAHGGGSEKVDWSVELVQSDDALWSDWGGRASAGYMVIVDTELSLVEVGILGRLSTDYRVTFRVDKKFGYRLRFQCNQYRGTSWGDLDGDKILNQIAPLMPGSDLSNEADKFIKALSVLS